MTRTEPGLPPPGEGSDDELDRFRALLANLPGIVYVEDADPSIEGPGPFLYVSPAVERILGYSVAEWLADPAGWVDRLHPDDVPSMRAAYQAVVPTGAPYSADYRMFAKDGRIVWIHDDAVLIRDEEGAPRYWQGVMYETTERPATLERLREAEQRYRALVEQTPVVTYIDATRPDHTSAYFSPQVQKLLGYAPDELTREEPLWPELVHPDDRDRILGAAMLAEETGGAYDVEYRMIAKDGHVVWVHDQAVLIRDEDGTPKFWQGVWVDVSEQKRATELERALKAEREEAAELRAIDELKTTFLQAVSHDLRTPLAAILGLAVTLEHQPDLGTDEARDLVSRISMNARKLDRIVSDLLDLDRISRGILEPNLRATDLSELVRRVVAESDLPADHPCELDLEPVMVEADAAKIERILENLLSNATRHTPAGSKIWIRVGPEGGGALLVVEDDGPGVPPEHREGIFQPFGQGAGAPEHSPGVGIGLAVVSRFAELHGGRAWVEEREGGGASFRVFLPGKLSRGASA
jgi:PAS domain S-box-containing protein